MKTPVFLTFGMISINLLIALIILLLLNGDSIIGTFQFIGRFFPYLFVGIIGLYISGKFIATLMNLIIQKVKYVSIPVGITGLFLILIIGILSGSSVGFIEFGIPDIQNGHSLEEAAYDYYFKPIYWILLFGSIPTIITGGILGYLIKLD